MEKAYKKKIKLLALCVIKLRMNNGSAAMLANNGTTLVVQAFPKVMNLKNTTAVNHPCVTTLKVYLTTTIESNEYMIEVFIISL